MNTESQSVQIEWNKNDTEKLIGLYERERVLWDLKAEEHKVPKCRAEALTRIATELGIDVSHVQKKIVSVRSQFNREFSRRRNNKRKESAWYGYNKLLFLIPFAESVKARHLRKLPNPWDKDKNLIEQEKQPDVKIEHHEIQEMEDCIGVINTYKAELDTDNFYENSTSFINESQDSYKFETDGIEQRKDLFTAFGEYVAECLRHLKDKKAECWARNQINQILFNAEMSSLGSFSIPTATTQTPSTPNFQHQQPF